MLFIRKRCAIWNVHDTDECFVWSMVEGIRIICREGSVFLRVVACKCLPFLYFALLIVVWQTVEDYGYVEEWASCASDVGGFTKHVFEVVI